MKSRNIRTISIICTALLIFAAFGGCAAKEEIVHPPQRVGELTSSAQYLYLPTLSKLLEKADFIAHVTIGNWLGELGEHCTIFEAKVNEVYRGENIESINLIQDGNGKYYIDGPLFDYGNELLLFMSRIDGPIEVDDEIYDYECLYKINGGNLSVCDISKGDNGDLYVIDRWGIISESISNILSPLDNAKLAKSLMQDLNEKDSLRIETDLNNYEHIFTLEDFTALITD